MHSGDCACSLPPFSLRPETIEELKRQTEAMARALNVRGLMNVQFAIEEPRRTSRASSCWRSIRAPAAPCPSWPRPSACRWPPSPPRSWPGETLASFGLTDAPYDHVAVKEAVFPFARFPGVDTVLGPEMRSTGEVMGLDWRRPGEDLARAPSPAPSPRASWRGGTVLPDGRRVFVSVKDADKPWIVEPVRLLHRRWASRSSPPAAPHAYLAGRRASRSSG